MTTSNMPEEFLNREVTMTVRKLHEILKESHEEGRRHERDMQRLNASPLRGNSLQDILHRLGIPTAKEEVKS